MGNREQRDNTEQIVYSVPHPMGYQLLAVWLAGVGVAVLTGLGFAVRPLVSGQWDVVAAWATGALFIPSLALALGAWSGNGRAFQIVHTLGWYLGAINAVAALDYMGLTPQAVAAGVWVYYLAGAAVLLGLAVLARWRRVRSRPTQPQLRRRSPHKREGQARVL